MLGFDNESRHNVGDDIFCSLFFFLTLVCPPSRFWLIPVSRVCLHHNKVRAPGIKNKKAEIPNICAVANAGKQILSAGPSIFVCIMIFSPHVSFGAGRCAMRINSLCGGMFVFPYVTERYLRGNAGNGARVRLPKSVYPSRSMGCIYIALVVCFVLCAC